MQYIIVVDKQSSANPSSEKRQYILNIDPLKTYNGVSDVLMITVERTYVIRKISVTKYGVPTIMPYPQEEELSKVKINLFEGDNYIYILDEIGNTIIATYILKNDFTDTFPAKVEMNTLIEQTASNIEISVNKKLEDYSTTEEMRAEIKLESDEINIEVSKKVGKEEVIAAINLSEEEASIKAEKISLEGLVTVNQKFKVLEDGSIEATNGNFSGDITIGGDDSLWILDENDEQYILLDAGGIAFFQDSIFTNSINRTHYETGNRKGISIKTQNTNSYITIGHLDNIALEFVAQDEKIYINTKTHFSEIPTINGTADGAIFKGATTKGITIENGLITGWNIAAATGIIFPDAADGIQVENGLITGWYLNGATGTLYLADSGSGNQVTIQVKNGLITGWTV